jgi:hypothetical protein
LVFYRLSHKKVNLSWASSNSNRSSCSISSSSYKYQKNTKDAHQDRITFLCETQEEHQRDARLSTGTTLDLS